MQSFLCALTFLTRIPLPRKKTFKVENFRTSIYYFPVVGLIIGIILGGSWFLLIKIFPPLITGALLLSGNIILTGGLHLDGFMDTMDGICGGRKREEMLAIMRDSRVGALGVVGVFTLLILKFSLYAQISFNYLPLLVLTPVAGRQAVVWAQILYPYVRQQGLGSIFPVYGDVRKFAVTTGITIFIFSLFFKVAGIIIFILVGCFAFFLAWYFNRLLGGLTGDTYGALCELTEIFVLFIGFVLGGKI